VTNATNTAAPGAPNPQTSGPAGSPRAGHDATPSPAGSERPVISVVSPLWNESPNVEPLVRQILQAFQNEPRKLEVILVDDASTDGSWERMQAAVRADSRVRALRLARHSGQSAALWAGLTASRGEVIATLDGDLQNDPADLPRLIDALSRFDMACGVRTNRMDSGLRRVSSNIARWARKLVLGLDIRDSGCNLRAFKRSILPALLPFDGLHRFVPILVQGAGMAVTEMAVTHHPRTAGKSKYGVWNRLGRGICDLAMVAWYRKRRLQNVSVLEHQPPQSVGPTASPKVATPEASETNPRRVAG
jgi:dolichol-phosphate mannosyltransferase